MKADLDDLRKRIDLLDESLVRLLNARAGAYVRWLKGQA